MRVDNLRQNKLDAVRAGSYPDNPALLHQWLAIAPGDNEDAEIIVKHFEHQFDTLMATVLDISIATQWRLSCLDAIFKPIRALQLRSQCRLSEKTVSRLLHTLAMYRPELERQLYL